MARQCGECDGPKARCPHCGGHFHCDDTECTGMPVECADAAVRVDEEDEVLT